MSTALTILLVMIASGPVDDGSTVDDPFTPAIARATREALGSETRVVMRMVATLPSDAEVVALGRGVHADAVVEVTWSLPDHLRTTIRVERSGSGRWVDRAIAFREIDAPSERSRTVGFAIASMLPERRVLAAAPPPPKRAVVTKAPPEATSEPEPLLHAAPPPEPPPEPRLHHASTLSGTAIAALGVGDHAGGVGGALDFRHGLGRALSLRIGVGARLGQDPPAGVVTRFFYDAAGLAWNAWTASNGRGAVGVRLDALLILTQFAHTSLDEATVNRHKLMPGGDLVVEAGYFFTRGVAVLVGGGGEAVFGQTDVFVNGRRAATLGPLHPVVELGLRAGF